MIARMSKTFGDAACAILFTPLNTRPHSYLVWVDSSFGVLDDDEQADSDIFEAVIDAAEEEFGIHEYCEYDFPAVDIDCGFGWSVLASYKVEGIIADAEEVEGI